MGPGNVIGVATSGGVGLPRVGEAWWTSLRYHKTSRPESPAKGDGERAVVPVSGNHESCMILLGSCADLIESVEKEVCC